MRNPYSRLLSCYLHRIRGSENSKSAKQLKRKMGIPTVDGLSFADFVKFVCAQEPKEMESHWRVQYDETLAQLIKFDFVGKQESLMSDINEMIMLLHDVEPQLKEENASPMRTGAREKLGEYYTDGLLELVAQAYKLDFEYFNYSYEL